MREAGIDGTKGGRVAIVFEDGEVVADHLLPIDTRFDELANAAGLAIEVPIGFGPRRADEAARRYLVGAANTVFMTPSRDVLEKPFGPGLGVSARREWASPQASDRSSRSSVSAQPSR